MLTIFSWEGLFANVLTRARARLHFESMVDGGRRRKSVDYEGRPRDLEFDRAKDVLGLYPGKFEDWVQAIERPGRIVTMAPRSVAVERRIGSQTRRIECGA